MFGCSEEQIREAGKIAEELACNWRELVAGSEGFLTAEGRRGLFRRPVEWGEQDSMVGLSRIALNSEYLKVKLTACLGARQQCHLQSLC